MKYIFRHQEAQVGEIWSFTEGLSAFVIEVREREFYRENGIPWLRLNLLVLHVLAGQEEQKGKELTVREAANSGHGIGMWTLRRIPTPIAAPEVATA